MENESRQPGGQADRQTDTQAEAQTDEQAGRQADRETDGQPYKWCFVCPDRRTDKQPDSSHASE